MSKKSRPVSVLENNSDNADLIAACEAYLDAVETFEEGDDLSTEEESILERALEMVYGKEVWGWINGKQ